LTVDHPLVRQIGIAFGSPNRLDSRLVHQLPSLSVIDHPPAGGSASP
jgi:hypothetical protein